MWETRTSDASEALPVRANEQDFGQKLHTTKQEYSLSSHVRRSALVHATGGARARCTPVIATGEKDTSRIGAAEISRPLSSNTTATVGVEILPNSLQPAQSSLSECSCCE